MNKSDYDKYYKKGGTYVIPVEVFNELFDELERLSFNYEQALEDLDKKENKEKKIREYIMTELITEWNIKNGGYVSGSDLPVDAIIPILEILDKENKE